MLKKMMIAAAFTILAANGAQAQELSMSETDRISFEQGIGNPDHPFAELWSTDFREIIFVQSLKEEGNPLMSGLLVVKEGFPGSICPSNGKRSTVLVNVQDGDSIRATYGKNGLVFTSTKIDMAKGTYPILGAIHPNIINQMRQDVIDSGVRASVPIITMWEGGKESPTLAVVTNDNACTIFTDAENAIQTAEEDTLTAKDDEGLSWTSKWEGAADQETE